MNPSRSVDKTYTSLDFLRFSAPSERPIQGKCLKCSSELTIHQPDINLPERLLGVCESCKHWYLIDFGSRAKQGVIVMLPDIEFVLELAQQNPSAGISTTSSKSEEGSPGRAEPPGTSP
jgi:hypothetical protein